MKFEKSLAANTYSVSVEGKFVGHVRRHDAWTVRGTRITWEAIRNGDVVHTGANSRKEAADHLIPNS